MGGSDDRRVTEYNPCTNTWRQLPSLQEEGRNNHNVCTLDNKIFALGGYGGGGRGATCEMMDLSNDDPHWRYIAQMNNSHAGGGAVVIEKRIYVLGGYDHTTVEVYDVVVDQGIFLECLQNIIFFTFDICRSVEDCYQHANYEIQARCSCT